MIDTVMALWNHGSQHRAVRIFFTLSLICMSISLLLVTIVIPGYILFVQQASNGMTANSLESNVVAPIQGGGGMFVATPKALGSGSAEAIARKCVKPTPQKGPRRRARIAENMGQQAQVFVPSSIPTPTSVKESRKGAKIVVESHHVYAGRPKGSVSHIQTSGQQGSISSQNVQETVEPFASSVAAHASVTAAGKTRTQLHSHVSLVEVPFQVNLAPIQVSSPIAQVVTNICVVKGS
jgi:hypothetical protein